jgi:plastocyanin
MEARMVARMGSRAVGLYLACIMAGCEAYAPTGPNGDPLTGDGSATSPRAAHAVFLMFDYGTTPGQVTLQAPASIEWRNVGATNCILANYSLVAEGDAFPATVVRPGGEFAHTFSDPGEYGFACTRDALQDIGYITVEPADMDDMMDMDDMTDMDDMMGMDDMMP